MSPCFLWCLFPRLTASSDTYIYILGLLALNIFCSIYNDVTGASHSLKSRLNFDKCTKRRNSFNSLSFDIQCKRRWRGRDRRFLSSFVSFNRERTKKNVWKHDEIPNTKSCDVRIQNATETKWNCSRYGVHFWPLYSKSDKQ